MPLKKVNAKNIFILPNNKNIILAANQAASPLWRIKRYHRYPDKDDPTGYYSTDQLYPGQHAGRKRRAHEV